mgnify:CR=1 FL=1
MKILNFGSLNIDKVYQVKDFVRPGETISSKKLDFFCGGKGLNQSIAISRAGARSTMQDVSDMTEICFLMH